MTRRHHARDPLGWRSILRLASYYGSDLWRIDLPILNQRARVASTVASVCDGLTA